MYVYSLCVYIDGYVCIVYALWSILYMCLRTDTGYCVHTACAHLPKVFIIMFVCVHLSDAVARSSSTLRCVCA